MHTQFFKHFSETDVFPLPLPPLYRKQPFLSPLKCSQFANLSVFTHFRQHSVCRFKMTAAEKSSVCRNGLGCAAVKIFMIMISNNLYFLFRIVTPKHKYYRVFAFIQTLHNSCWYISPNLCFCANLPDRHGQSMLS